MCTMPSSRRLIKRTPTVGVGVNHDSSSLRSRSPSVSELTYATVASSEARWYSMNVFDSGDLNAVTCSGVCLKPVSFGSAGSTN